MDVAKATISFNSLPQVTVAGKKKDFATMELPGSGGKKFQGVDMGHGVYAKLKTRENGKFDVILFRGDGGKLSKSQLNIKGGVVSRLKSTTGETYEKSGAKPTSSRQGVTFNSKFATKFSKGPLTTKTSSSPSVPKDRSVETTTPSRPRSLAFSKRPQGLDNSSKWPQGQDKSPRTSLELDNSSKWPQSQDESPRTSLELDNSSKWPQGQDKSPKTPLGLDNSSKWPQGVDSSQRPQKLDGPSKSSQVLSKTAPKLPKDYNYKEYVQKFGSKTANLYEMERIGVKVPGRSPVASTEIFSHLMAQDTGKVIQTSWEAMQKNGKVDDDNLKAITDKIEEIFDKPGGFPFTKEQQDWINVTMAGKVIIARSTGDEDSADTPNAGGNESVLFVEPNTEAVSKAMKEVVLSYFGADSLRNRIVGDGVTKVLADLPKMPVLLMEMIAEPIKDPKKVDQGVPPPIGIAMSTDKVEFTGGEDFHFVSISSAIGPGVNEGNGRVEVDESFVMQSSDGTPLLIFQQPSIKQERIRAEKDGEKIKSQLQKNSVQQAYNPSLSRDEIVSLVTSTDKIKGLNKVEGEKKPKTTEVEGVVGSDGQINFVQHRPIPDSLSNVKPTYVDLQKAEGHSQAFGYTTVVPKSGDALVISDWSQVCFAETMKEAEALFDWKGGTQKLVIVRQPDGSNSHPAVNFGSYKKDGLNGTKEPNPIPCLVVPNYGELLALKKSALSKDQPLVIDGQTQKAFVWKDKTFDQSAILDGRISHHIGLETSVTDKAIADLVGKLKTTQSKDIGGLKKELDLVLDSYGSKIEELETFLTKNADTIHNSEGLRCQLQTAKENFVAVKAAFKEILEGNPKYTFNEGTHARLLLVKFLEASMHGVDSFPGLIEAERSASRYLQALQGAPSNNAVFGDQVHAAKGALTGPLNVRWKRFLALAEQSGLTSTQISEFKTMMEGLDKMGVTANWMSTVFDKKYAEIMPPGRTGKTPVAPKAKELLEALVKDYQNTSEFLGKQQSLQKQLEEVERNVADFATPSKFDKAFSNLKSLAKPFIDEEWPKDLNENPLKKAVQVETLGRLIEVYDTSIKTLKGSSLPADQMLKAELEMLDTFKDLYKSLFDKVPRNGPKLETDNPQAEVNFWKNLNDAHNQIKQRVATTTDLQKLDDESRCGSGFNVNACLYTSGFKEVPSNVEELFTTVHQSLEEVRSGLMVGGSDYGIDMPKEMHDLIAAIPKLAMQTVKKEAGLLVGRDITSEGVTFTYNMLVLDHGIKVRAIHEKPTTENPQGKTSLEIDFYAANSGGRLQRMATLAKQFSFGSEERLDDPSRREVTWGQNQMKAKFTVRNQQDIEKVTTLVGNLCGYSMAPNGLTGSPKHTDSLAYTIEVNDPTSGSFLVKRERVLNDFLNVTFGTVTGEPNPGSSFKYHNTDYKVKLTPSGPPIMFNDGTTNHTLDLNKEYLGLDQGTFNLYKDRLTALVEKEVLHGSHKFSFEYQGKTYNVDLNKSDLGLTPTDLKGLSLNSKHLGTLKGQLSQAWDNATFYLKGRDAKVFRSDWTEFMYGPPMSYSNHSKLPELELWKSASEAGKKRGELVDVDKAFEKTLQKKYALQEIETRVAERGIFASPKEKMALDRALQDYYQALSRCELVCGGYVSKQFGDEKYQFLGIHSKVLNLGEQTVIERKAIENRMLVLGMEPERISKKEAGNLPFASFVGKNSVSMGREFI